jgi:hypothetical protein
MSRFAETDKDVENVEAWATIIADLLCHAPPDRRAAILALATTNEETEAQERGASGRLRYITFSDDWMNSPGVRHRNAIARIKSLLVQVFVRDIANNHSKQDAANILFTEHPHGRGSRMRTCRAGNEYGCKPKEPQPGWGRILRIRTSF